MNKVNKTIFVHYSEQYDGNFPLHYETGRKVVDFIAWLNDLLADIPKEYRDSATIEIDSVSSYEDSHYVSIQIQYTRPETDEEAAEREAEYHAQLNAQRARELRTLAELEAKYRPPRTSPPLAPPA